MMIDVMSKICIVVILICFAIIFWSNREIRKIKEQRKSKQNDEVVIVETWKKDADGIWQKVR